MEGNAGTAGLPGPLRRYQRLALDAFERERAGRRTTHVLAPPGAGKTVLGLEIARRRGARALVLCPNTAVQAQWLASRAALSARRAARGAEPRRRPLACSPTRRSAASDGDRRWAAPPSGAGRRRGRRAGAPAPPGGAEAPTWRAPRPRRLPRELARDTAGPARDRPRRRTRDSSSARPADGRALVARRQAGRAPERSCSTSATTWPRCGATWSVRWSGARRHPPIGLTATPPDELPRRRRSCTRVFGPVDFRSRPRPWCGRRPGALPGAGLAHRAARPARRVARGARRASGAPHRPAPPSPPRCSRTGSHRLRIRRPGAGRAEVPWGRSSGGIPPSPGGTPFLASAGLRCPTAPRAARATGATARTTGWSLLEDYALRCLAADPRRPRPSATRRSRRALRDLGYVLTRQGIRRAASDVDRLAGQLGGQAPRSPCWASSRRCAAKAAGAGAVRLRARRPRSERELRGVLDPQAGSAARGRSGPRRRRPHRRGSGRCWSPGARLRCAPTTPTTCSRRWPARPRRPGSRSGDGAPRTTASGLVRLVAAGPELAAAPLGAPGHRLFTDGRDTGCWWAPARCWARAGTLRR